jgi:hypothetical protein
MAKQNKKQTASKTEKEPTDEQLQGNQHDKIIKESIDETMFFLLKTFANIDVVKSEQLPTEIQQTKERKPDFLKIITDKSGLQIIGHLEFHIKDEADISYRAFETCSMMKRKKPHLDIFQIIIYMGEKPAENIIEIIEGRHFTYKLKLIQFIQTPVEVFLQAESAAEVVLGILSDFGNQTPEIIIPQLVEKIVKYSKTDLERLKFLQHLRIFSKLRNFGSLINHIMENTIAYFGLKDEDDYMYKRGEAKTEARFQTELAKQREEMQHVRMEAQRLQMEAQARIELNKRLSIINLLDVAVLSDLQIMKALDVSEAMVHHVKKDLAAAPKKIARLKEKFSAEQIAQQLSLPINWVEKHL